MKRQRCEGPTWCDTISEEIRSNGGHVHPSLRFDEGNRALIVTKNVDPGTVLLRIPGKSMITEERAIVLCPWLASRQPEHKIMIARFANSVADLWIALALASQSPERLLYLHSLPESSNFDALPRRWSDDELHDLLGGTSLLERAKSAKEGAVNDYTLLKQLFEAKALDVTAKNHDEATTNISKLATSFPPFGRFSDMLAAVSSRAFQIGPTDQDVAMVPLLDLCDHARGRDNRKNVSYEKQQDGSMLVKSTSALSPGERLKLTYGAQGNAQLLFNYGFCIPNNLEPDGSSNDVLEFLIHPSTVGDDSGTVGRPISLRTGPKAYSYGGFINALELFCEQGINDDQSAACDDESDDGFQCFLNQNENDTDLDEFDTLYTEPAGNEEAEGSVEVDRVGESRANEENALKCFRQELIRLSEGYSCKGDELRNALSLIPCHCFYAAILCQSELRTIYFFLRAIEKVRDSLYPGKAPNKNHISVYTDDNDVALIEAQTTELAKAYMAIRHGT